MTTSTELSAAAHAHYRSLLPNGLQPTPGGLADGFVGVVAEALVQEVEAVLRAVLDWLPQTASADALRLHGETRSLSRWPDEPLDTWRRRVIGAADFWALGGTMAGVSLALAQAGYRCTITEHIRDPDETRWAEFSVAVSPLNPIPTAARWGDGTTRWGDDTRWGLNPNAVPTRYLVELIREVKPAHAVLRQLTYFPQGRFWGSTVEWGDGRDPNPPAQPGWGVWTGYQTVTPAGDRTDSGAAWGESDAEIIYQLEV